MGGETLTGTYLVKSLLHQLPTVSRLYQRALGGRWCSPKSEEALRSAVAQQAQEGVGLLRLQGLEARKRCDVARLGSKSHQLLAVFIMDQLLLRDFLHFLTHALPRRGDSVRHDPQQPGEFVLTSPSMLLMRTSSFRMRRAPWTRSSRFIPFSLARVSSKPFSASSKVCYSSTDRDTRHGVCQGFRLELKR